MNLTLAVNQIVVRIRFLCRQDFPGLTLRMRFPGRKLRPSRGWSAYSAPLLLSFSMRDSELCLLRTSKHSEQLGGEMPRKKAPNSLRAIRKIL